MTATPAMATHLPSHHLVGRSQTCTLGMQAMHLSLRCAAYIGMLSLFGIVALSSFVDVEFGLLALQTLECE